MVQRAILAIFMALFLAPEPTHAQGGAAVLCGARDQVVEQLQTRLGESVRSIGLAPRNRIVEVFASDETGSWTIAVTTAEGMTCLIASGHYFESMTPPRPGQPL